MADQPAERQIAADFQTAEEVRRLSHEWVTAFVGRDADALERIMAEDFAFTYPLEGDDKEQFISDVKSGELTADHLDRADVTVRVYGACAVLTCLDTAKWNYKGHTLEGQYRTLQVYVERGGRWQLVAVQSCPIPH